MSQFLTDSEQDWLREQAAERLAKIRLIHDDLSDPPENPLCECGHGRDEHHGPVEKYGLECFPCEACGCPDFSRGIQPMRMITTKVRV